MLLVSTSSYLEHLPRHYMSAVSGCQPLHDYMLHVSTQTGVFQGDGADIAVLVQIKHGAVIKVAW